MSGARKIAASIIAYLRGPEARAGLEPDAAEGLAVAAQCLEASYGLDANPEDAPLDLLRLFTSTLDPESKARADALKNEGNALMKQEKHREALDKYTEAIALDPTNAIYFCNRAAARSSLKDDEAAIGDCKRALALNPKYGRAYGRLGLALTNLGRHREARDAYAVAVGLEPDNEAYRNNLSVTDETLRRSDASSAQAAPPLGVGVDLGSLLQNQALASVATQMLSDPGLQNLMGRLLGDLAGPRPNADSTGRAPDQQQQPPPTGPAAGIGGLDALLQAGQQLAQQMQQANPEFVEQLRQQMANATQQQPPTDPARPNQPKPPQ